MSDEVKALEERVAELERELARVARRLNVALELIGECRVTGYPESVGIVDQRLEQAERVEHFSSDAEDTTATNRAAEKMGRTEPSLDVPAPPAPPASKTEEMPAVQRPKWEPFVPSEAPLGAGKKTDVEQVAPKLSQQQHRYDQQTEAERKVDRAIGTLEGLGTLKKK